MNQSTLPSRAEWWIARKDLARIWPLAVIFAALMVAIGALGVHPQPFDLSAHRHALVGLLTLAAAATMALLVTLIVQHDPLPGSDQDWKVRPIRGRELLAAKVLAIIVVIPLPLFIVAIVTLWATGIPLGHVLSYELWHTLLFAGAITLPMLTIAALTRSPLEVFIALLAILIGVIAISALIWLVERYGLRIRSVHPIAVSHAIGWIWRILSVSILIVASSSALALAYLWRRMTAARIVLVVGMALAFRVQFFSPWRPAYALQSALSQSPSAHTMSIRFAPDAAERLNARARPWTPLRLRYVPKGSLYVMPSEHMEDVIPQRFVRLVMPFDITGLPTGKILHSDVVQIRIAGPRGEVYRGDGWNFDLHSDPDGAPALLGVALDIPRARYRRLIEHPVSVQVLLALTVVQPRSFELSIPSTARLPGLGHCAVREAPNSVSGALQVACQRLGGEPCVTVSLEPASGRAFLGTKLHCAWNYEPQFLRKLSLWNQFEIQLAPMVWTVHSVQMLSGHGYRGVLAHSHVVLSEYRPLTHTLRRIDIDQVHLAAWRYRDPLRQSAGHTSRPTGSPRTIH